MSVASTSSKIHEINDGLKEENDVFFFESEHLALKGNKDYSELLKTIAVLESQRAQAIKDIDTIIDIQKEALNDPVAFVDKIKNKENLCVPQAQTIVEIPSINWEKYNVPIPEDVLKLITQDNTNENSQNIFRKPRKPKNVDNSSATFNKPWTSEEQKKLEELLIKFPLEAIEMRRYKKIAEALGNRTVKQVTSRVQKYFLKLHKAGLPVPGRIPKTADKKRIYSHKHQRHNSYLYKPSTFFPDMEIPVFMPENDDDIPGASMAPAEQYSENSNSNGIDEKDELQLKIDLLRRVKIAKEQENDMQLFAHVGYKCDICNEEPIIGSRWHCFDCKQDSVDFCTDCVVAQLNASNCHPLSHRIVALHDDKQMTEPAPSFIDPAPSFIDPGPSTSKSGFGSSQIKEEQESDSASDTSSESDSDKCPTEEQTGSENDSDEDSVQMYQHHYDKDYVSDTFMSNSGKYNYLDPNFLPE